MSKSIVSPKEKPGHFTNWLSFLSGNEDAMLALVIASEWKPEATRNRLFSKPQMHVSGHVVQIITLPGQVSQA